MKTGTRKQSSGLIRTDSFAGKDFSLCSKWQYTSDACQLT